MFLCMFVKLWLLITFTPTHISDTIDDDNNLGRGVIVPVGAQRLAHQYQGNPSSLI
jgi:hypothetical protein